MNAEMPERNAPRDDNALRAILISNYRLSEEQVDQINFAADSLGMSFVQAALHLEIITENELADAREWSKRFAETETVGPVESAMRRIATISRKRFATSDRPRHIGEQLVITREPYNAHSEKIRALRTELMMMAQNQGTSCVLAIVSAFSGEGRSQLAAELAIAFAQLGRNTLLVDADLRHPRQHQLFQGAEEEQGLAQALAGKNNPTVHPVAEEKHLSVLPTGTLPPNPLELLSDQHFKKLVADWRNNFDFVLIDTPPISDFADGLAVATVAERALVMSRAEHTTYRGFRSMMRRLATAEAWVMGAVVNHF
jgi:receptor protein-tyrosine kinase